MSVVKVGLKKFRQELTSICKDVSVNGAVVWIKHYKNREFVLLGFSEYVKLRKYKKMYLASNEDIVEDSNNN